MGWEQDPSGNYHWVADRQNPLLANLPGVITAGSALLGGLAAGGANAAQRAQAQYDREQAARQAQMAWLQSQMTNQTNRAVGLADRMPLGAEQSYVQSQGLLGGAAGALSTQPLPSLYGGVFNPFVGMDLTPYGTEATSAALAERRKALAGIDPNFQFGGMASYGLQGPEVASAEQQVSQYARDVASKRMEQETAMTKMLNAQYDRAAGQGQQGSAPKKGGFWSGLGKTLVKAAPLIISAVPGAGAPKGTSFASNIQKAVLSPRGMAQMASAFAPGPIGQAVSMVAPFLKGADYSPARDTANTSGPFGPAPSVAMPIARGNLVMSPDEVNAVNAGIDSQQQDIIDQFAPSKTVQAVKPASARAKATQRTGATAKVAPQQKTPVRADWANMLKPGLFDARALTVPPPAPFSGAPSSTMFYPATNQPGKPETYSDVMTQPNEPTLIKNLTAIPLQQRMAAIGQMLQSNQLKLTPAVRTLLNATRTQLQAGGR